MRSQAIPIVLLSSALIVASLRAAADPQEGASAGNAGAPPPATSGSGSVAPANAPIAAPKKESPAETEKRSETLAPKPSESSTSPGRTRFVADPITDGAIFSISAGFVVLSQGIISSGEIRPQQPVGTANLAGIDKFAVTQTVDSGAGGRSNVGLYAAVAFAIIDPIITGVREESLQSYLVDAIIYGQSLALTGAVTNISKLAVRRPRPRAYTEQEALNQIYPEGDSRRNITNTDSALSFFSGHASTTACAAATATYLAFARSPRTVRPWITLIIGTLVTAFVSYERVRAGEHFPTDVLAGAMAGAGIGALVPHFHREQDLKQRPVWIGFNTLDHNGALATVGVAF